MPVVLAKKALEKNLAHHRCYTSCTPMPPPPLPFPPPVSRLNSLDIAMAMVEEELKTWTTPVLQLVSVNSASSHGATNGVQHAHHKLRFSTAANSKATKGTSLSWTELIPLCNSCALTRSTSTCYFSIGYCFLKFWMISSCHLLHMRIYEGSYMP